MFAFFFANNADYLTLSTSSIYEDYTPSAIPAFDAWELKDGL